MDHRDRLFASPLWSGSQESDPHAMPAWELRTESNRKLLDGNFLNGNACHARAVRWRAAVRQCRFVDPG